MLKKATIEQIIERYKGYAIISYPFNVGGQLADRWMWMMTINGEVIDYHTKNTLKQQAERKGFSWIIIRMHQHKPNCYSVMSGKKAKCICSNRVNKITYKC